LATPYNGSMQVTSDRKQMRQQAINLIRRAPDQEIRFVVSFLLEHPLDSTSTTMKESFQHQEMEDLKVSTAHKKPLHVKPFDPDFLKEIENFQPTKIDGSIDKIIQESRINN